MRLDEWQRWLDTQFLDAEEPAPRADQDAARAPDVAEEVQYAAPLPDAVAAVPEEAPAATQSPRAVTNEPMVTGGPVPTRFESAAAIASLDRLEPVQLAGEMDVPAIENYLPFLRRPQGPTDITAYPPGVQSEGMATSESESEPTLTSPESPAPPHADAGEAAPPEPLAEEHLKMAPETVEETPDAASLSHDAASEPAVAGIGRFAASARRARQVRTAESATAPLQEHSAADLWRLTPRGLDTLLAMGPDDAVQNSYKRAFKESRIELISRLLDPTLSLEDTARLLNVCPTTVRRYTQRGILNHQRTKGDQRRFKLSDVLGFLEAQGRREG